MIDIKTLKERITELEEKLSNIKQALEKHVQDNSPVINEKEFFKIYNDLSNKKFKLENQIDEARKLLKTLEFIFED